MRKKLLITGASGFVGFHLVYAAHKVGYEVHAAVRSSSNVQDIKPYVDHFVYPKFNSIDDLRQLFNEQHYEYVIHAAALTKAKSEEAMWNTNVRYTLNLIEAAFSCDHPPKHVTFVSSLAAIGPIKYSSAKLIDEKTEYQPVTEYGRSKKAAELAIKERFSDKPISIIRPTAVYGPREKDIFILFKTLNKGLDAYIGRNPQKLSFIYVKDLVDALLKSLFNINQTLSIYNLTDGHVYPRYAVADIFKKVLNRKLFRFHVPFFSVKSIAVVSQWLYKFSSKTPVIYPERLHELTAENWGCDINKVKNELGFDPKYDLEKGLKESLDWYKMNKWL